MRIKVQTSPPEHPGPQGDEASNLIGLLCSEKALRYLGRGYALKLEVLAQLRTGSRSLAAIGREYQVSKQAVSKIAKKARAIYGGTTGS
jgi:hypothetical protein